MSRKPRTCVSVEKICVEASIKELEVAREKLFDVMSGKYETMKALLDDIVTKEASTDVGSEGTAQVPSAAAESRSSLTTVFAQAQHHLTTVCKEIVVSLQNNLSEASSPAQLLSQKLKITSRSANRILSSRTN